MNDLVLIKSAEFNGVQFDCYVEPEQNDNGDFWATREQIGQLLEYTNPRKAIKDIHIRNKERLDKFSKTVELRKLFNGAQFEPPYRNEPVARVYNFKGLLEICRYSNQPKADAVMDWLWEVADEIRRTGSYTPKQETQKETEPLTESIMYATKMILEAAGIKANQLALALDKVAAHYTGKSLLALSGIVLEAASKRQILNPTAIGQYFGVSSRKVNSVLIAEGYQRKVGKEYEPLELGMPFAVMLDTNKWHSDGTPVRQLKWDSSILTEVADIFYQRKLQKQNKEA